MKALGLTKFNAGGYSRPWGGSSMPTGFFTIAIYMMIALGRVDVNETVELHGLTRAQCQSVQADLAHLASGTGTVIGLCHQPGRADLTWEETMLWRRQETSR